MKLTRLRRRVTHDLKVDVYKLVARAVEEGVARGWQRAHKHTDEPTPISIKQSIEDAVLAEMSEIFIWPNNFE